MSIVLWILLGLYLTVGAIVGFALTVWGSGMRGYLEGKDILLGIFALFLWLPYGVWKVLKVALLVLLPTRITNRLFPVKY